MTTTALIKLADARRLARIAKSEGVAVSIEMDGRTVTFFPDFHRPAIGERIEEYKDIKL